MKLHFFALCLISFLCLSASTDASAPSPFSGLQKRYLKLKYKTEQTKSKPAKRTPKGDYTFYIWLGSCLICIFFFWGIFALLINPLWLLWGFLIGGSLGTLLPFLIEMYEEGVLLWAFSVGLMTLLSSFLAGTLGLFFALSGTLGVWILWGFLIGIVLGTLMFIFADWTDSP